MIKVGTIGELRHAIRPFTDECPTNPIYVDYNHSIPEGGRIEIKTEKEMLDLTAIEVLLSRLSAECKVSRSLIKEARDQFKALTGRPVGW